MRGYAEFRVEPRLSPFVVCLWRHLFVGRGLHHHRILPDGCVDIVQMGDAEPVVVGPDTKAAFISFEEPTEIVGIRLMPGIAATALRATISNLINQTVPLAEFRKAPRSVLRDRLNTAKDWRKKLALLQAAVFDRPVACDRRVADAVATIALQPHLNGGELASRYGITARHLLRLFETHVGYGPKTLARIFRLQRALAIHGPRFGTLADLAFAAGYADQPHMDREFRLFCSSPPSNLLPRTSTVTMSDLFKTAFSQV